MTQFTNGLDALNALTATNEGGGNRSEITSLSGATFKVKVIDKTAVQMVFAYGIHGKSNNGRGVNSFIAKTPSVKSKNGYPVENYTPWDLAWKYHKDRSEHYQDAEATEANKYRAKQRFVMAFYDLTEGKPVLFDLSKNQALAVAATITEYSDELGELAFEIKKVGEGPKTTAVLTPIINMAKKLTPEEIANFENAPAEFPPNLFDGIWFEKTNDEMIALLTQAGFDISLIGLAAPAAPNKPIEGDFTPSDKPLDVEEDDLPF